MSADLQAEHGKAAGEWRQTLQGSFALDADEPFWDKVKMNPLLDEWFKGATPPVLTPDQLWQAMQEGDTPFYRIKLQGKIDKGQLQIQQAGASTITHLLALQGGWIWSTSSGNSIWGCSTATAVPSCSASGAGR